MAVETLTGITKRELFDVLWKIMSEFMAANAGGATASAIAVATAASGDATTKAADVFWRQVKERSRPLSEVLERADEEATPVVMIVSEGGGTTVELLEYLGGFARERERFSGLVEALTPDDPIPSTTVIEQARRNAHARAAFLIEFPTLSSADVADLYGSEARNRAALAQSWRKQHRIFAVATPSGLRFPLFQFQSDGQPKPYVGPVLRELQRAGLQGWEVALWFTSALASLDNARPVDVLDRDPGRVEAAAAQLSAIPF